MESIDKDCGTPALASCKRGEPHCLAAIPWFLRLEKCFLQTPAQALGGASIGVLQRELGFHPSRPGGKNRHSVQILGVAGGAAAVMEKCPRHRLRDGQCARDGFAGVGVGPGGGRRGRRRWLQPEQGQNRRVLVSPHPFPRHVFIGGLRQQQLHHLRVRVIDRVREDQWVGVADIHCVGVCARLKQRLDGFVAAHLRPASIRGVICPIAIGPLNPTSAVSSLFAFTAAPVFQQKFHQRAAAIGVGRGSMQRE